MNKKKLGGFLAGLASLAAIVYGAKGQHHNPTQPAPQPGIPLYTLVVHVCEGDVCNDEPTTHKAQGAIVTIADRPEVIADGAGNADVPRLPPGSYHVCATAAGYKERCADHAVPADGALYLGLEPLRVDLPRLTADGRIFRANGQPWRWKGVSSFALLARFARGEGIGDTLAAYRGFNLLRVWPYVPAKDWGARAWDTPDVETIRRFVAFVNARGFYVELTLLTDADLPRLDWARALIADLTAGGCPAGLVLEAANEPQTHKNIYTAGLRGALEASGCLFSSGDYEDSARFFGTFMSVHTARDSEWPRRAHDLIEYFNGGGPNAPTDPAHHVPIVADEPAKLQDVGGNREQDWLAYFAACSLLGAGATFHSETGKWGLPPTADEAVLAAAALRGLTAFPADAPLGPYSRPDEGDATLRTYRFGPYTVRIRPTDGVVIR